MNKKKKEVMEHAHYIFTTGKLIHDRILHIHTSHLAQGADGDGSGELSLSQMQLVRMIRNREETTITELAELLQVSPPSASVMVDRLVEKGIVTRQQSRADRRKVLVRISPEAIKRIEKIENAILFSFVELVEKIGPQTSRKWCEVLARIKEVLREEQPKTSIPSSNRR